MVNVVLCDVLCFACVVLMCLCVVGRDVLCAFVGLVFFCVLAVFPRVGVL